MKQDVLDRFLNGLADPAEREQCEAYLKETESIGETLQPSRSDSLLQSLQARDDTQASSLTQDSSAGKDLGPLIAEIQRMVPTQAISEDELDRILDPAESPDELGRVGRFRVLEFIASGGMGLVFRAEEPELNRPVCIKVMHPLLASRSDAKQRFDREARASSRLQHERIVTVFEVGEHRDLPYLVMELLEGESLRSRLRNEDALSIEDTYRFATQIAEGLRYAHSRGFLHRDIKPDNVWLTLDGNVKLLDFGLARAVNESIELTSSGTIVGTPRYMSPEQVQGKPVGETSDLFSMGIVIHEMVTGESPFKRENVFSTMMSVANDPVSGTWGDTMHSYPSDFISLIESLLAKNPDDRPASADSVIRSLEKISTIADPIATQSDGKGAWLYALGGAIVCACLIGLGALLFQATDKGTLVVEADPEVEVRLADEVLTIRDPETGKTYTIKIGEQPLPSGVYQLEMTDASSELTFSSEVITISRGKQRLVRVMLRPSDQLVDAGMSTGDRSEENSTGSATVNLLDLETLPALDAVETSRAIGLESRSSISPFASVVEPGEVRDWDTWSLEPALAGNHQDLVRISTDGQRVARSSFQGFVRIYDDSFQLTHMLPVSDHVMDVSWSPHPDVLIVVIQGQRAREAMIWRLRDNGQAEILQRIPVEASKAAWSPKCDRIAFQSESSVTLYNVETGQVYAIRNAEIRGALNHDAWSSDGTMLAVSEEDTVKVWSLGDGQLLKVFPSAANPIWLGTGHQLALMQTTDGLTSVEVWDIDTLGRLKARSALPNWVSGTMTIDDQFRNVVALSKDGKLVTGNVNGEMHSIDLVTEEDVANGMFHTNTNVMENLSELALSQDGSRIVISVYRGQVIYAIDQSGQARRISGWDNPTPPRMQIPIAMNGDSQMVITAERYNLDEVEHLFIGYCNLESLEAGHFEIVRPNVKVVGQAATVRPSWVVKPNHQGDHVAILERLTGQVEIRSIQSGEVLFEASKERPYTEAYWSSDGTSIVFSSYRQERRPNGSVGYVGYLDLLDLNEGAIRSIDVFGDGEDSLIGLGDAGPLIKVVDNRLYAITEERSRDDGFFRTNVTLEFMELPSGEKGEPIELGSFPNVYNFDVVGDRIWWLAQEESKDLRSGRGFGTIRFYTKNLSEPNESYVNGAPFYRSNRGKTSISSDGRYISSVSTPTNEPASIRIYNLATMDEISRPVGWEHVYRAERKPDVGSSSGSLWHSSRPQLAMCATSGVMIYDVESESTYQLKLLPGEECSLTPAEFGWIATSRSRMIAIGFEGQYLGKWVNTDKKEPGVHYYMPNRWISADGSTKSTDEGEGTVLVRLEENRVLYDTLSGMSQDDRGLPRMLESEQVRWPW